MAPSIEHEGPVSEHGSVADDRAGPDPIVGAGTTLLGIFIMGTAGARDAHYAFDIGVVIGMLGAVMFVGCVALSAMRQRRALKESGEPPA